MKIQFIIFLFLCIFIFVSSLMGEDLYQILESGNFKYYREYTQNIESLQSSSRNQYFKALEEFYRNNLINSKLILDPISADLPSESVWLYQYLKDILLIHEKMILHESSHFKLRVMPNQEFLVSYALDALEKAYQEIGGDLAVKPDFKISVEIYSTQDDFIKASTLSKEILDRSGAIAVCKFRRLMILSPDQLSYGYRWLDALSHEYTHFLVNLLSQGQCPLWLNEGIAKYFETRWRFHQPYFLTPGNQTELVDACQQNKLISFKRMEPSMVYLDNQTQVRLAFSQVSHAVHYICNEYHSISISKILVSLSELKNSNQAFLKVFGIDELVFEGKWIDYLKQQDLPKWVGSVPDIIKVNSQESEYDDFLGTDSRGYVRLGDRMRQTNRQELALFQYEKALNLEPYNPIALIKKAKTMIALGKEIEAVAVLEKSIEANPNYAGAYFLLCDIYIRQKEWGKALYCFEQANSINPFNPEIHQRAAQIYLELKNIQKSDQEMFVYKQFKNE